MLINKISKLYNLDNYRFESYLKKNGLGRKGLFGYALDNDIETIVNEYISDETKRKAGIDALIADAKSKSQARAAAEAKADEDAAKRRQEEYDITFGCFHSVGEETFEKYWQVERNMFKRIIKEKCLDYSVEQYEFERYEDDKWIYENYKPCSNVRIPGDQLNIFNNTQEPYMTIDEWRTQKWKIHNEKKRKEQEHSEFLNNQAKLEYYKNANQQFNPFLQDSKEREQYYDWLAKDEGLTYEEYKFYKDRFVNK